MKSLTFLLLPLSVIACGDNSSNNGTPDMAMAPTTLGTPPMLAMPCTDTLADVYTLPAGLPAMDDSHRGDVFRCAPAESMTLAKVNAQIDAFTNAVSSSASPSNFEKANATTGMWTFRIAYRSERNTVNGVRAEGDMAAFLIVPEKPLANAPLVVFDHGSVGVAPKCAPSHRDLSGAATDDDYPVSLLRLAGYGYTVIAPDYSGYSYGQAPVGYFNAEDEAHAVLDATRAAAKILPSPPDKVVFVGHSQGGHAVVSAQSYAKSYGLQGTLVGVAAMAPLFMSMSLWGAATTDLAMLSTKTDFSSVLYSMEYNYAAMELRNPGHGKDVFQSAKAQAAVDTMYAGECYDMAKLQALGSKPSDFYDSTFVTNVGGCALPPFEGGNDCTAAPAPTWTQYWKEDRPPLDPTGAPLLLFYGGADATVKPGWAACMRDNFTMQAMAAGATLEVDVCYDANAMHRDIIRGTTPDYINQWIAAQAGAGSAPAPCTPMPSDLMCAVPFKDL